jgi:hypothetical protein
VLLSYGVGVGVGELTGVGDGVAEPTGVGVTPGVGVREGVGDPTGVGVGGSIIVNVILSVAMTWVPTGELTSTTSTDTVSSPGVEGAK